MSNFFHTSVSPLRTWPIDGAEPLSSNPPAAESAIVRAPPSPRGGQASGESNDEPVALVPTRRRLPDARDDRLYFAQVREDPLLEIDAMSPVSGKTIAIVTSGGCTALSLIAADAGRVTAIDVNRTQNHLLELKIAALVRLTPDNALSFLGGAPESKEARNKTYVELRPCLSGDAQRYWDAHQAAVTHGVLESGVSERFLRIIVGALKIFVHSQSRCAKLLEVKTLAEQEQFYRTEWDNWRWRLLFNVLCNRWMFERAYDPGFFRHLQKPSFALHFRTAAEHGLTAVPAGENYFLHQILTGFYPASHDKGLPPYLDPKAATRMNCATERLEIADGSFTKYLRTCSNARFDGFSLSNICEWLTPPEIEDLFAEIVRTAKPGARLCYRNFIGWTEVPAAFRHIVVEDRETSEHLTARDRSLMQRRFAVCHIAKPTPSKTGKIRPTARDARPGDNAALLALAGQCPMEGEIGMYVDRAPDYFAVSRLEGPEWRVGVTDDAQGRITGCISLAAREAYLHGVPQQTMYAGDLKAAPGHRNLRAADALSDYARDFCRRSGGPDIPVLSTILTGNRAMEYRARGLRGTPKLTQFATLRSHAISLLWPRRKSASAAFAVRRASADDIAEMAALWQRVAPGRQFAPVFAEESLRQWIARTPTLEISDYRLAHGPDGRLAGFFAVWDQNAIKRTRITQYSRRIAAFRAGFNLVAPLFGAPSLPRAGEPLNYLTVAHVCVPPDSPAVLRALLVDSCNAHRRGANAFLTIALDVRDPLSVALRGLMPVVTDFGAYVWTPDGPYAGADLDDRPFHFEIATV